MGVIEVILAFMEKGGNVLWLIATLVFFMWTRCLHWCGDAYPRRGTQSGSSANL